MSKTIQNNISTSGDVMLSISKILNNDEILHLPTIAIEVVPAPGENKVLVLHRAVAYPNFFVIYGDVSAPTSYNTWLQWTSGSVISNYANNSFFVNDNNTVRQVNFTPAITVADAGVTVQETTDTPPGINQGIAISVFNDTNFSGGDAANSMTVTVFYSVLDV